MIRSWSTLLLGARLKTSAEHAERIGPLRGVAVLGLDALASAAYGPEALLTILLVLGARSTDYLVPLTLAVVVIVVTVSASYRQTIGAYPSGGGSYTVAKENLGRRPGLIAAAALALDYVLNVAVAIAAGAGAIVSAIPALLPHTLALCIALLGGVTMLNLRGIRSTAGVFLLPAYLFVGCLGLTLAVGIVRAISGDVPPTITSPETQTASVAAVTPWLLARAFANGSTAMTGIEAVSNGVPLFAAPSEVHARRTLAIISTCLVALLIGLALVCYAYQITATPPGRAGYESVLSRVVATIWGRGVFYHVTIAAIVAVLAFSANTSFASFPRLAQLLARDRYLPEGFVQRGRRLVFSHGIIALAVLSAVLLITFGGITDHLIPLFAVGALLSFTLSQAGMVRHWQRSRERHARVKLAFNLAGAIATGSTFLVVIAAKLQHGAWISLVLIAGMYAAFCASRRHYDALERMTALQEGSLDLHPAPPPHVVVPVRQWDRPAQKALHFAYRLSQDVTIVQVLTPDRELDSLEKDWEQLVVRHATEAHVRPPKLVVLPSEYRELFAPLLRFIKELADGAPSRSVAVVVPQIVEPRWYHVFYHHNTAALLKALLLFRGGPKVIVLSTPWYVAAQS